MKKSRHFAQTRFTFVALVTAFMQMTLHAQEASWDATKDFTLTSNSGVNGVWSYGYADSENKAKALLNVTSKTFFGKEFHGWSLAQNPSICRNESAETQHGVEPGKLMMHPGMDGPSEQSLLTFTAPTNGKYSVKLRLAYNEVGDGVSVSATKNLLSGAAPANDHIYFTETLGASLPDYEWKESVDLKAGETLSVSVGNGALDSNGSDSTVVELVISRSATP